MNRISEILAAGLLGAGFAAVLPSCQSHAPLIPTSASMVAEGRGDLTYVAPRDGRLYIYDRTWNKVVWSGDVVRGQIVKIDAPRDRVFVDGTPVIKEALGGGDSFQFYMDPRATVVQRTVIEREVPVERRTVIEREIHQ